MFNFAIFIGGIVLSLGVTMAFFKGKNFIDIEKKQKEAEELINESKKEAEAFLRQTKERVHSFKRNSDEDNKRRSERLEKLEESMKYKEDVAKKREDRNNELKRSLENLLKEEDEKKRGIENMEKEVFEKLSLKAGESPSSVKEKILEEERVGLELANGEKPVMMEEKVKENANKIAKNIIVGCMQRLSSPTSVEARALTVKVPKDFIKGKIVGKEACNIKIVEELLEVYIVFNDLPQTISISGYNLVVRRVAQKTIEKLVMVKGDINKEIIEQKALDARKEMDEELLNIGKKAVDTLGFKNYDPELLKIIGRLQFRTSYGQNIMKHSMEVAWVCAMLAAETGMDTEVAKVAGFLHDLGKAIDQDPDQKDAHDYITKELMEKYGFSWEEVHAAWTHHDAEPQQTPEAFLIKAADAVSAGRPGARQESIHSYNERIAALEETVSSFKGVDKTFTMSAGREVRAIVDPRKIDDKEMPEMAKKMAEEIEENVTYPGKIKVNLIRRMDFYETVNKNKKVKK